MIQPQAIKLQDGADVEDLLKIKSNPTGDGQGQACRWSKQRSAIWCASREVGPLPPSPCPLS
jgi:hypothetical protein